MNEILSLLPEPLKILIQNNMLENIEEIRIRTNKPIILKNAKKERVLNIRITNEIILQILQSICDNSIYSYQNQICNGFITLKGGNRVGIVGNAVLKDGQLINISHINGMNFRIARQVINCSNEALKYILNTYENSIYNTLIISPPGMGKTTLLRDIVRQISNGIPEIYFQGLTVGVIDERDEIAAMYQGMAQNDIGIRTDVFNNIPKALGIKMLIRSMSPKVIVADEIGKKEDVEAIKDAVSSGVKGIFTAHGKNIEDFKKNPILKELEENHILERILFINPDRSINCYYEKEITTKKENVSNVVYMN